MSWKWWPSNDQMTNLMARKESLNRSENSEPDRSTALGVIGGFSVEGTFYSSPSMGGNWRP